MLTYRDIRIVQTLTIQESILLIKGLQNTLIARARTASYEEACTMSKLLSHIKARFDSAKERKSRRRFPPRADSQEVRVPEVSSRSNLDRVDHLDTTHKSSVPMVSKKRGLGEVRDGNEEDRHQSKWTKSEVDERLLREAVPGRRNERKAAGGAFYDGLPPFRGFRSPASGNENLLKRSATIKRPRRKATT
jgi:hypothetical protein